MQHAVAVVIFEGFEMLDAFGPVEMLNMHPEIFQMHLVAQDSANVVSAQGPRLVVDSVFADATQYDILLVPGGPGTRREVDNSALLQWLKQQAQHAQFITSVCTGSALLARAGLLDGVRATSNKKAFDWAMTQGPKVDWVKKARWVEDGNIWTSSGVSAGMDMTLALIEKILSHKAASDAALWAEYQWQQDKEHDPFAKVWGLVED